MSATHVDYSTPGFVTPVSEGERFFYEHAGWSYDPRTQTPEEGRWEGARQLRAAELHGEREGWSVEWTEDPDALWDDDVDRESTDYDQWQATLHDAEGEWLGSLGSVDFGPDQDPWSDPYARVVAAELMLDAMHETR